MKHITTHEFSKLEITKEALLSVRTDRPLINAIDELAMKTGQTRSRTVRVLLQLGLSQIN